jgi:4'-phosphopantetheinyl transferase
VQYQTIQIPKSSEIHIWRVGLERQENAIKRFERLLSSDERLRSGQFHFEHLRQRYIITHGALRVILAGYCGRPPEALQFGHGRFGKPFLVDPPGVLEFNISHSDDLSLIAVTAGQSVGIDVEKVRQLQSLDLILNRYFSVEERRYIDSTPEPKQTQAFFTLWTRREAVAKALSLNLEAALMKIQVPLYPFGGKIVVSHFGGIEGNIGNIGHSWYIRDLKFGADYRSAVCVEGKTCDLSIREFK